MIKRNIIALYTLIAITCLLAFIPQQQERQYYIGIPERLIDPYYRLMQGSTGDITPNQLKELQDVVMPQIQRQYLVYAKEDSLKTARLKDSINKKP